MTFLKENEKEGKGKCFVMLREFRLKKEERNKKREKEIKCEGVSLFPSPVRAKARALRSPILFLSFLSFLPSFFSSLLSFFLLVLV